MNTNDNNLTGTTQTNTPIHARDIKPNTKVMCSKNVQLGVIEGANGSDSLRLKPDATGVSHFIPLSWVTRVDDTVHLDRPGDQAMREWSIAPRN